LVLTAVGTLLGIAAALGLTTLIESMLFRIPAHDPVSFAVVPIVLLFVAITASSLPALRASKVNPVDALRQM
jgi:ABC-type antimicrobial peptide transport system permease subunit